MGIVASIITSGMVNDDRAVFPVFPFFRTLTDVLFQIINRWYLSGRNHGKSVGIVDVSSPITFIQFVFTVFSVKVLHPLLRGILLITQYALNYRIGLGFFTPSHRQTHFYCKNGFSHTCLRTDYMEFSRGEKASWQGRCALPLATSENIIQCYGFDVFRGLLARLNLLFFLWEVSLNSIKKNYTLSD